MRKDILKISLKNFQKLSKRYNKFINVFVDNWRGYRFVFDAEDVRKCNNGCVNCDLFKLLKDEKENLFSAGLYLASENDKKLFGQQNFLNCKTIKQYEDCYANFLIKKTRTKQEIIKELNLIKTTEIIFSRNDRKGKMIKKFRRAIIKKSIRLSGKRKIMIIKKFVASNSNFF